MTDDEHDDEFFPIEEDPTTELGKSIAKALDDREDPELQEAKDEINQAVATLVQVLSDKGKSIDDIWSIAGSWVGTALTRVVWLVARAAAQEAAEQGKWPAQW